MPGKIITASEIRKLKGYDEKKSINANELLSIAARFFMKNDLSSSFIVRGMSFSRLKRPPECGYYDATKTANRVRKYNKMLVALDPKVDNDWRVLSFLQDMSYLNVLIVDNSYLDAAALVLRNIGGYIVTKYERGYVVRLVA